MAQPLRWPRDTWSEIESDLSDSVRQTAEQQLSNVLVDAVEAWLADHGYPTDGPLREMAVLRAHHDLTDMAADRIVHFAARAREHDLPWSAIAAALGYSHQEAAMARWGDRVRDEQARYRQQSGAGTKAGSSQRGQRPRHK